MNIIGIKCNKAQVSFKPGSGLNAQAFDRSDISQCEYLVVERIADMLLVNYCRSENGRTLATKSVAYNWERVAEFDCEERYLDLPVQQQAPAPLAPVAQLPQQA